MPKLEKHDSGTYELPSLIGGGRINNQNHIPIPKWTQWQLRDFSTGILLILEWTWISF